MDTTQLNALVQGDIATINAAWQGEVAARNAIAGDGIDTVITELFPGVDAKLLASNRDLPNILQEGASRYTRAMTRGELNWEYEGEGDAPKGDPGVDLKPLGRNLVQDATMDALVSGKFAFYPHVRADGKRRLTALAGFLWPVYEPGDVNEIAALLQIISYRQGDKTLHSVRRYSPGLVEVWAGLEDWTTFPGAAPQTLEQPHARDRLPVAFRIVGRDAKRQPEGIAQTALPAFRRYVKFAVLLAFIATRGGFEERVVKSDMLTNLAKDNPRHPLVQELKRVGVNMIRLMDSGATYERLDPVVLGEYREQEAVARADVRNAMNMPDTGGDLSGEALAEKREAYTESVESIAGSVADALTEAHELGAALRPAELRPGWRVNLSPRFTRDVMVERKQLLEEFKAGLPKSVWLSGLQSLGVAEVTDAHIEAALAVEEADTVPTPPVRV